MANAQMRSNFAPVFILSIASALGQVSASAWAVHRTSSSVIDEFGHALCRGPRVDSIRCGALAPVVHALPQILEEHVRPKLSGVRSCVRGLYVPTALALVRITWWPHS